MKKPRPNISKKKPVIKTAPEYPKLKASSKKQIVRKGKAILSSNSKRKPAEDTEAKKETDIRLNRFIANSGICSRRDADDLIARGEIKINGEVVKQLGVKVKKTDKVEHNGKVIKPQKFVYVLLNKPKGFITTMSDPEGRKTVMDLVANACEERIYPVGRLDRLTTGTLLFTNDGDFAQQLAHPSKSIPKIYEVTLNRPITEVDFNKIKEGTELEDGLIKVDDISLVNEDAQIIGIKIHSGRNRIVRRLFEHYRYTVEKLDRVMYAGLDKKGLSRGQWRYLSEKEIIRLKYFQ